MAARRPAARTGRRACLWAPDAPEERSARTAATLAGFGPVVTLGAFFFAMTLSLAGTVRLYYHGFPAPVISARPGPPACPRRPGLLYWRQELREDTTCG